MYLTVCLTFHCHTNIHTLENFCDVEKSKEFFDKGVQVAIKEPLNS